MIGSGLARRIGLTALILGSVALVPDRLAAQVPGELSAELEIQGRLFPRSPLQDGQGSAAFSLALRPEYFVEWDDGRQAFLFEPFLRLDSQDPNRTHFDIGVLSWELAARSWELRLGFRKVFWGVTESQHLVDIINQTDLVEGPDGEEKLGQLMFNFALIRRWGTVDVFLMPLFRQRTFPGSSGRLRLPFPVDEDRAEIESGAGRFHPDLAVRWSHTLGDWDLGVSHFYGTSRDPRFRVAPDSTGPVLIPVYELIHQTGVDVQLVQGGTLWKLEAITRSGQGKRFIAVTAGLEHTLVGVFSTSADLGLIAEYLYDSRGGLASDPTNAELLQPVPFENDVFVGTRLALNDIQSTEVLAGVIVDWSSGSTVFSLEASRRLADSWTVAVEARVFAGSNESDPLYWFRRDDYLEFSISKHF